MEVPGYVDANGINIPKVRMAERYANGTFIDRCRDYKGAARVKEKTVEEMRQNAEKQRAEGAKTDKT